MRENYTVMMAVCDLCGCDDKFTEKEMVRPPHDMYAHRVNEMVTPRHVEVVIHYTDIVKNNIQLGDLCPGCTKDFRQCVNEFIESQKKVSRPSWRGSSETDK